MEGEGHEMGGGNGCVKMMAETKMEERDGRRRVLVERRWEVDTRLKRARRV